MDLLTYIKDMKRRAALASAIQRSPDYLWQVATNRRRASPELAMAIEAHTTPTVPREAIRPDLWQARRAA